jgi:hypothetical protein
MLAPHAWWEAEEPSLEEATFLVFPVSWANSATVLRLATSSAFSSSFFLFFILVFVFLVHHLVLSTPIHLGF